MKTRLLCSLVVVLVGAAPAAAELPGGNGQIAFDSGLGYPFEIWAANQDGSAPHKIADGSQPSWSPDGNALAFVSAGANPRELAVVNADGTGQRLVNTGLGPTVSYPSWSPDGNRIVLGAFGDIYVVPSAGGSARLIVRAGFYPAWSPSADVIAFARNSTLMLVNADGSDVRPLVQMRGGGRPSWSPDGTRIAYESANGGSIDVVAVKGGRSEQLVGPGRYGRSQPSWSPDGTRIVFRENGDLCTVAVDGSSLARLTYTPITPGPPGNPAWQPLRAGSAAGEAGRSAGPPNFPRGTAWYPGCDQPEDKVTVTVSGPSFAQRRSWVTYVVTVRNEGKDPIPYVRVSDRIPLKATGGWAIPSQGRCGSFWRPGTEYEYQAATCELGGFRAGDVATVRFRVRYGTTGPVSNTAVGVVDSIRTAKMETDVVACTLRGSRRADRLRGSPVPDVLCGLGGNDILRVAGGGRDTVFCGDGFDRVLADASDRVAADCEEVARV